MSRALGTRPLAVQLEGLDLVLFRHGSGVGALDDRCLHRGMRLSRGKVEGGRLVCPYHGWSYCPAGGIRSPGTPSLRLAARPFETAERHGLIWVRDAGGEDAFPQHLDPSLVFVHSLSRTIAAPIASVIDNFTEVEHTGIAHWQFGYDPRRLDEIELETTVEPGCVRMRTIGPQRPLWPSTRLGFGIGPDMLLVCEWETSFLPPRSVWRWYWQDPRSRERRGRHFKAVAYFNARSPTQTQLLTYYFWSPAAIDRFGFGLVARPLIRLATRYEVALDSALIEGLCAEGRGLPPTGASRFDQGLVEQRRQLAAAANRR